jgi:hypothetical protein
MSMRRSLMTAGMVGVALSSSACGWIFVEAPPVDHAERPYFTCTQSKVAPTLDVVWGGLNVLGAVVALATPEDEWDQDSGDRAAVVAVGLGWGVVSGLSAYSGYRKVDDCRQALEALALRSRSGSPAEASPSADASLSPEAGPGGAGAAAPSWRPPELVPVRARSGLRPAGLGAPAPGR